MATNVFSTDGTVRWRRAPQSIRHVLGLFVGAAIVLAPFAARAQDSTPPSEPPTMPPAPPPAAAPPGAYVCTVTDRGELNDVDAVTAADVVCGELKKQGAPGGPYTVRFGHLGSRTRLVVASATDQRDAWFSSMDEVEVAAARLVEALVGHRPLGETEKVDSVLSSETHAPRVKNGQLSVGFGIIGATTAGVAPNVSAGASAALLYRVSRYGLFGEGRASGMGSAKEKLSETSLGIGGHTYLGDGDVAPFAGGGLQLARYGMSGVTGNESGSGLGAFAELGVAASRTSKVAVFLTGRVAFPLFNVSRDHGYVLPLTMNLGLTFL